MVIDVGGGTTDSGNRSRRYCSKSASVKVAGDKFDEYRQIYEKESQAYIGERTSDISRNS